MRRRIQDILVEITFERDRAPTSADDVTQDCHPGVNWIDNSVDPPVTYICTANVEAAAVWSAVGGGGGGSVSTAANVGSTGTGLFKQLSGSTLQFRNVAPGSNKIAVALDSGNNAVTVDVDPSNLPQMVGANGSSAGTKGLVPGPDGMDNLKFLRGDATWQAVTGEANTASNVGTGGQGLFKQKSSADLQFRNIGVGSSKISVALNNGANRVDLDLVEANLTPMVGANGSIGGTQGVVPAPLAADNVKFLRGDGTWATVTSGVSTVNTRSGDIVLAGTDIPLAVAGVSDGALSGTDKQKLDNATSSPTVSTLVLRDSSGRAQVVDPSAAQDIATKGYVDAITVGLSIKPAVSVATSSNIVLTGEQTIDGVLTSASRVLVRAQTLPAQNGIYVSGAGAWTRATDMDTWAEVPSAYTFIQSGSTLADSAWVCTSAAGGTIDVTDIVWAQFSSATAYTAGTGLTLSGFQFAADFGTGSGKVTQGNDSRLTDARTPSGSATGDLTGTYPAPTLVTSGVTANTYGDASHVAQVTFDAKGRATSATPISIAIASGAVSGLAAIATSGSASDLSTGTVPSAQMPALTGDVTTVSGNVATTIASHAVTNAKAAQMAAHTFKGNNTGSTADAIDLSITQLSAELAGTSSTTLCVGNDSRLSDARSPSGTFGMDGFLNQPLVKSYTLSYYAARAITITSLKATVLSGSLTASVKINGSVVTSISGVTVNTGAGAFAATGANTVAAGDLITLTVDTVSSPVDLAFSVLYTVT